MMQKTSASKKNGWIEMKHCMVARHCWKWGVFDDEENICEVHTKDWAEKR